MSETSNAFDVSWWVALLVPFVVSLIIYLTNSLFKSASLSRRLSYVTENEQGYFPVSPERNNVYGEPVMRQQVQTKLLLWNDGTDVLEPSNFASSAPLKVKLDGLGHLINFKLSAITNPHSLIKVVLVEQDTLKIDFEYLNSSDGLVVDLSHTGKVNAVFLEGSIKGSSARPLNRTPREYGLSQGWLALSSLMIASYLVLDMVSMLASIYREKGIFSIWFFAYLPIPVIFITGCIYATAGFIVFLRDKQKKFRRNLFNLNENGQPCEPS